MKIPEGTEVTENLTSIYWIDEDGILCSISKKAPRTTLVESKQILEEFKKVTGGRKFCMLLDVTHATTSDREAREFAAVEFPKIVTAMAMISASPLGRMMANLFFALKPTPYPAKMFNNEKEAKDWLKQYL